MADLKAKPFYLNDEDIKWVNDTLAAMSDDEKLAQLFCLIAYSSEEEALKNLATNVKPGGLMLRPMPAEEGRSVVEVLQKNSKIPMLLAANLERGGNGVMQEGTSLGSPLAA